MNPFKWQLSLNSLRIKLVLSALVMTLPLVGMLIYNNIYAIDVVRGQVADTYSNSLTLYMNQIDEDLNDVDAYMNAIGFGNDLLAVGRAATHDDYYSAKFHLHNKLVNDIALYRSLNSFFVYEEKRQDYMDIYTKDIFSYEETERVKTYISDLIDRQAIVNGSFTKRWQHYKIGTEHYLIDIVQAGDAYLGAWVRTDYLLAPLQPLKMEKGGEILFVNEEGEPISNTSISLDDGIKLLPNLTAYSLSDLEKKYLIVGAHSNRGSFSLLTLIPESNILANLPYLQRIIWMITIGSMVFIPVGLYLMRRSFFIPLNRLLHAMKRVRGGDWSIQVNMQKTSDEFQILGDSFNSMMTEIQTLRINVFEEQLNNQREELHRLQLQVNPHFFLNALNIVFNLAKVKNFELIQEMTESLIHYFRYLFRNTASFVKLRDELEHTRNYLIIQSLRFPGQLTWLIDVPEYLSDTPVPPLVIQSFVENSIKHAVTLDEPIGITVRIQFFDKESGSKMRIIIKDTGCGFSKQVLGELQAGRNIQNERGEHTGIWNVGRRLRLLYKEPVSIQFDNDKETGGAVVEMILPTTPKMEDMT